MPELLCYTSYTTAVSIQQQSSLEVKYLDFLMANPLTLNLSLKEKKKRKRIVKISVGTEIGFNLIS